MWVFQKLISLIGSPRDKFGNHDNAFFRYFFKWRTGLTEQKIDTDKKNRNKEILKKTKIFSSSFGTGDKKISRACNTINIYINYTSTWFRSINKKRKGQSADELKTKNWWKKT